MNTKLRAPIAALALLLPLSATLVATPAAAQQRAIVAPSAHGPAHGPAIRDFDVRASGRLIAGRQITFEVRGTPRASASLDIPGVVRNLALRETRPGVYEGRYTIRRQDDLRKFDQAVATLRQGRQQTVARADLPGRHEARRDQRPPQVSAVTPAQGQRVADRRSTEVSARLHDEGSGVNPASVRLRLNGVDVTRQARVSADAVRFRDDLPRGRHTAELVVSDRAGNATRQSWSFVVG